jgi:hypothetical protein
MSFVDYWKIDLHYDTVTRTRAHLTWRLRCATRGTTSICRIDSFQQCLSTGVKPIVLPMQVHYNYTMTVHADLCARLLVRDRTMRLCMQGAVTRVRVCRCLECRLGCLTYCITFDQRRSCAWMGSKTVSPLPLTYSLDFITD